MSRRKRRHPPPVVQASPASEPPAAAKVPLWIVAAAGLMAIGVLLWFWTRPGSSFVPARTPVAPAPAVVAEYVDEQRCASCHAGEVQSWHGSHHDLAMQEANADTVLGNFDNASFSKDGVRTRFFMRDGRYWINTDGEDGRPADFEVKYTFGVEPLQQYLLQLDRGRLQAFTIAWDTHRRRWFHLYPDEHIDHRDELHWTRLSQNWNFMCAECHSTDLKKNYDESTQTYHTTWKQIDVGCQACHGPASVHLARMRDAVDGQRVTGHGPESEQRNAPSPAATGEGWGGGAHRVSGQQSGSPAVQSANADFPLDLAGGSNTPQIEMCARCHSRRATLWGDYQHGKPLLDTHLPSLLETHLYFADGQIDGEVYEYGSFLQAKMHRKGLRCSDCHDPHSLQTRLPDNALCTSCHNATAPAARASIDTSGLKHKDYDSPAHHFHQQGRPGSQCVDCHAPQRTYMVVDPRRDHSFRIPRPDLSVKLGTPNACNMCHTQRSAQWAATAVAQWYGPDRRHEATYGEALWAGRTQQPGAQTALTQLVRDDTQPAIARATAMQLLQAYPGAPALEAFQSQFQSPDPMLRLAALDGLGMLPAERRAPLTTPFLNDPVRAVRLDAVSLSAPVPAQALGASQRQALLKGVREFEVAQHSNTDQPSAWANLGNLYGSIGDGAAAEAAYQSAIRLDASFVPAYVNLADLKSRSGDNTVAVAMLQSVPAPVRENAAIQHALGLALTRERRYDEAIRELKLAAGNDPDNARYAFVYGVALHDTGRTRDGVAVLRQALQRHPTDRSLLMALAMYAEEAGDTAAAQAYRDRAR